MSGATFAAMTDETAANRRAALSRKNLPPLATGTTYRSQDFEYLEFVAQRLYFQVSGEDTAILRLHLSNATILEIPISDGDLQNHMRLLMDAFPTHAIDHLVQRWPQQVSRKKADD